MSECSDQKLDSGQDFFLVIIRDLEPVDENTLKNQIILVVIFKDF